MKFTSILSLALGFVATAMAQTSVQDAPTASVGVVDTVTSSDGFAVPTSEAVAASGTGEASVPTSASTFGPYGSGNSTSSAVGSASSTVTTATKSSSSTTSTSSSSASSTATGGAYMVSVDRSVVGLVGLAVLGMAMA